MTKRERADTRTEVDPLYLFMQHKATAVDHLAEMVALVAEAIEPCDRRDAILRGFVEAATSIGAMEVTARDALSVALRREPEVTTS